MNDKNVWRKVAVLDASLSRAGDSCLRTIYSNPFIVLRNGFDKDSYQVFLTKIKFFAQKFSLVFNFW
jgi:hypothetical protein